MRTSVATIAAAVAFAVLAALVVLWLAGRAPAPPVLPPPGATTNGSERAARAAPAAAIDFDAQTPAPHARERTEVAAPPAAATATGPLRSVARVHGSVVDTNGAGVAGATVRVGTARTTCGADGAFTIPCRDPDDTLVACAAGHQPALVPGIGRVAAADGAVTVVLPGAALAIEGFVRTADGAPAAGWNLHLHGGGTLADDRVMPPLTAEDVANGASVTPTGDTPHAFRRNPNELCVPADGAFRIGGLRAAHDYVLRAWHPTTLQTARSGPIRAGTRGHVFTLPPADCRRVVGRVVDRQGGPVAGVRVRLTFRLWSGSTGEAYESGQTVDATGADGAFAFEQVARENLLLRFDGAAIEATQRELTAAEGDADVIVVTDVRCRFRLEPDPAAPLPAAIAVLDGAGQRCEVHRQLGPGKSTWNTQLTWRPGDEEHELSVCDRAATLLLLDRDGRELRRIALVLPHGAVTVVRR